MFNVACELSQPMGKTEFSSTPKNRRNCLIGKKNVSIFQDKKNLCSALFAKMFNKFF